MELGYARVSTTKQDLDRQIHALTTVGIAPARIYVDKKSGATTDRPGLREVLDYARSGDRITVHTLDRLGRTVRDTLNLIHDLAERGVGIRNLADPIRIDSANPDDPMAQLAVIMLALFGQMERTYAIERAAQARAVAAAKGRWIGRPSVVKTEQLEFARLLRDQGATITDIVAKTGITRTTLYRHLPARPVAVHTAAAEPTSNTSSAGPAISDEKDHTVATAPSAHVALQTCPNCGNQPTGRRERAQHRADLALTWLYPDPDNPDTVLERRHCSNCQPHQHIDTIACSICGDGPLLAAGPDSTDHGGIPDAVQQWLVHAGLANHPRKALRHPRPLTRTPVSRHIRWFYGVCYGDPVWGGRERGRVAGTRSVRSPRPISGGAVLA